MNLDTYLSPMSLKTNKNEDQDMSKTSLSGKLMFSAIIVMFFVMVFILCIHIYARCYLLRSRRRRHLHTRNAQLVFYIDPTSNPPAPPRRLESSVLDSLPVFDYSPEKHTHLPECAVCLSEFEENDKGRLLPKCNHGFHIECIDMWFLSHSTCPLCRSFVEPVVVDAVSEPGPSERRKQQLEIDIPNRGSMDHIELGQGSPAVSQGLMSPFTRFLSFTNMLSLSRRSAGTTPSGVETSPGETSVPEDVEKALEGSMTSAQTPK